MTTDLQKIVNITQLNEAIDAVYDSFPDGTVSAPGLSFANDKTTGITRNEDSSLSFVVKGKEILKTGVNSIDFQIQSLGGVVSLASKLTEIVSITDFGIVHDPDGKNIDSNTTFYNNALTACSGVCKLHHPENITVVIKPLTITKPISWQLDGMLMLAPMANANVISLESSDVFIHGKGTVDGNRYNQVGGVGTVQAGISANTTKTSVAMPLPPDNPISISNILIDGITIQNCFNWPISLGFISDCVVKNTTMKNSASSPQFIFSAQNSWFLNNHVYNVTDGAFVFYQGNNYCGAIGNLCHDCHDGIGVYCDNDQMAANENILILGNIVYNNRDSGIAVTTGGDNPLLMQQRVLIEGNVLRNNNTGGRDGGGSIGVVGGQGITVAKNNIFQDGYGTSSGLKSYSIFVDGVSQFVNIDGNVIGDVGAWKVTTDSNSNTAKTGGGIGIFLASPVNCSVTNNVFYDTQSSNGTMVAGVGGGFGVGSTFKGNYLLGAIPGFLDEVNKYADTVVENRQADGALAISGGIDITSGNLVIAQGVFGTSNYYGATAQGTSRDTAQAFNQQIIVVNSALEGSGVLLPVSAPTGVPFVIHNRSGNNIKVYAPSGTVIEGLSDGKGADLKNTKTMVIVRVGTGWYGTVSPSATSDMPG